MRDLINTLDENNLDYENIFGIRKRIDELTSILNNFENCPRPAHWMAMHDIKHFIFLRYDLVIYFISKTQCLTFLPI